LLQLSRENSNVSDVFINVWTHLAQPSAAEGLSLLAELGTDWKMLSPTRAQFVRRGSAGELGKQSADPYLLDYVKFEKNWRKHCPD
jgi:hypothetical protein